MNAPIYKCDEASFGRQISTAKKEVENVKSSQNINLLLKHNLILKIETEFKRLDREVTDQFLKVEVRYSINLIEKTLAEAHLCSLKHLNFLNKSALEITNRIKNFQIPIPQKTIQEIVQKYESLIKQVKIEIFNKQSEYPIPEPWCSKVMTKGLKHIIESNFIFTVWSELSKEMKPLNLSDRDLLFGGLTRQKYNIRLDRVRAESDIAIEKLRARNVSGMEGKLKYVQLKYETIGDRIKFAFEELENLYKDGRALEYLVKKNYNELLKTLHNILLRKTRHYYDNRINIPSVAIDYKNDLMLVAPPKAERNIPIASGVDRGATARLQLVTPASVVVVGNSVFVADKYGYLIPRYRDSDLAPLGSYRLDDTPDSLSVFKDFLFVCSTNKLVQFSLLRDSPVSSKVNKIEIKTSIDIPQICCTASNDMNLFVGTLKPTLILIDTDTLRILQEYPLNPIRYHIKKRYSWLQDMKASGDFIYCLFTGSPSPLQVFTLKGELINFVVTEDKIGGAYHFDLFWNPVTEEWRIYITDFWNSVIKVFDIDGQFIETFSEKGFGLGQIIHPTGIFVEETGFITLCDMKEDNCLQRL